MEETSGNKIEVGSIFYWIGCHVCKTEQQIYNINIKYIKYSLIHWVELGEDSYVVFSLVFLC